MSRKSLQQLQEELQRQILKAIIVKYARLERPGKPMECKRGYNDTRLNASEGKIIYDDREHAEAAAQEMLERGRDPQYAYECPWSRHGHHHLTRKRRRE